MPEAETYAASVREAISPNLNKDGPGVSISEPHEVVPLMALAQCARLPLGRKNTQIATALISIRCAENA